MVDWGVFVQEVLVTSDGVWLSSIVSVTNWDGVGEIVGDILNSGVAVIMLVIVKEGLSDGRTTAEGVAVIVHSVVADSVGGMYDVPVRVGWELGVRV